MKSSSSNQVCGAPSTGHRHVRRIVSHAVTAAVVALLLAAISTVSLADSGNVINNLGGAALACPGNANVVFADINNDGTNETLVVFQTVDGEAYGNGAYFYTGNNNLCGGAAPWPKAKIAVWFVDALAPGFVVSQPSTWQYKSVSGVRLSVNSNEQVIHGDFTNGYRQVAAYTQRHQGGTLVDSFLYRTTDPGFPNLGFVPYQFSSASGIMEIYISSDFSENLISSFVIASSLPSVGNDTCSGAIALSENAYFSQNTTNATDDGVSTCLGRTMSKGVWFTYTPAMTGVATVDTCPSDFDTMIEVFTNGCSLMTSIGCNDDACSYKSSLSFTCTAGTTYLIWAGGYNGASGNLQIRGRVLPGTLPVNDECSGGISLSENLYYQESTANATHDGYSTCLGNWRTKGVWFTYKPALTGKATVDTCPSDFDTMIEVFTGGCSLLASIGCNDDACGYQSSLTFPCTAGTTYQIWAGGYNAQSGNLQIRAREPVLSWQRGSNGLLGLAWATAYVLQSSPAVTGPWSNVSGIVNTNGPICTYSTAMTNTAQFFRIR